MDKLTANGTYIVTQEINGIGRNNVALGFLANKQHEQFVENNITLANNWLGFSGDLFLFSANTISAYLRSVMGFYEANATLLKDYALAFGDIDSELKDSIEQG